MCVSDGPEELSWDVKGVCVFVSVYICTYVCMLLVCIHSYCMSPKEPAKSDVCKRWPRRIIVGWERCVYVCMSVCVCIYIYIYILMTLIWTPSKSNIIYVHTYIHTYILTEEKSGTQASTKAHRSGTPYMHACIHIHTNACKPWYLLTGEKSGTQASTKARHSEDLSLPPPNTQQHLQIHTWTQTQDTTIKGAPSLLPPNIQQHLQIHT